MGFGDILGYLNPLTDIQKAKNYFFDEPAAEQKAALDQASATSAADTQKLVNFYMQQQQQAQGYYKPLQQMFANAYGTAGLRAPQTPQAPGKPLAGMYGGM